jgi:hypothetical protein
MGRASTGLPNRVDHPGSDGHYVKAMIETPEIVRIRREHHRTTVACSDCYRGVDDIGGRRHPAELSRCSRLTVVKDEHLAHRRSEEPGKPRLTLPIPPCLGNHPCRNHQRVLMLKRSDDDRHNSAIVPLEADQRPGVENESRHRPSALSAAFRSTAVSGPPVSASISSSIDAKSSSFACSSKARAT